MIASKAHQEQHQLIVCEACSKARAQPNFNACAKPGDPYSGPGHLTKQVQKSANDSSRAATTGPCQVCMHDWRCTLPMREIDAPGIYQPGIATVHGVGTSIGGGRKKCNTFHVCPLDTYVGGIHIRTIHVGVTGHFMGTQSLSAWTGGGKAECVVRTFRHTLSSVKDANYPDVFAFVGADGKFQGRKFQGRELERDLVC